MDGVSKALVVLHGLGMVACAAVLGGLLAVGNARLSQLEQNTGTMASHTREMASSTRVHYEPTTFNVSLSDRSKTYTPGYGIPACTKNVRQSVNGDNRSVWELMAEGYYVMNTATHSQTGNQTDESTGRSKSESEVGYKACDTTGLLYILRKDLGEPTPR